MRNRVLLLGGGALAAALVALALRAALAPPRLEGSRFTQVRVGMTREQVEAVLGVPPGDYTSDPSPDPADNPWAYSRLTVWACDDGVLYVGFDDNDVVVDAIAFPLTRPPKPSLPGRLRTWLGF